jgi:hypothetical protein
MNEATVIRVDREGTTVKCRLANWPRGWFADFKDEYSLFDQNAVAASTPNGSFVKTRGGQILRELCKNENIKKATEYMTSPGDAVRPLYVDTGTVLAESVWWEAMYHDKEGFLALQPRWPIARLADAEASSNLKYLDVFKPPLRILAVISAAGIPGRPEWDALNAARDIAAANHLPVEIRVLTGDKQLFQEINDAKLDGISTEPVPKSADSLDVQVGTFAPNLLHFFCHGIMDAGAAWLQMRTGLDDAPFKLDIRSLARLPSVQKVWLIVLNSCFSATPAGEVPSMAYRLVRAGIPIVVGALEQVDPTDAHEFTAAFYEKLFYTIATAFDDARPKSRIIIDWMQALHAARVALDHLHQNPEASNQWILPVMYERRDQLVIVKDFAEQHEISDKDSAEAKTIHANMTADLLRYLGPVTPKKIKEDLVGAIYDK